MIWAATVSSQTLGNLVSIFPNTATQGQSLTTTITEQQGSWIVASPPCDNMGIYLEKSGVYIYCTNFNLQWPDIIFADFTIPPNADPGFYNVYVAGATWDPWFWNCSTIGYWELLSGFEITGTTGIVGPAALTHAYVNYNQSTLEFTVSPEFKSEANDNLFVFDIYGKEMLGLPVNGKQNIYLDKHLLPGIYFFRIGSFSGKFTVME
jgi:hypothetical protein